MVDDRRSHAVAAARQRAAMSVEELWLDYLALGGEAGPLELEAYLHGLMPFSDHQHDVLAHALNERLDDLGLSCDVIYSDGSSAS